MNIVFATPIQKCPRRELPAFRCEVVVFTIEHDFTREGPLELPTNVLEGRCYHEFRAKASELDLVV